VIFNILRLFLLALWAIKVYQMKDNKAYQSPICGSESRLTQGSLFECETDTKRALLTVLSLVSQYPTTIKYNSLLILLRAYQITGADPRGTSTPAINHWRRPLHSINRAV
jgi:hypothetical protein